MNSIANHGAPGGTELEGRGRTPAFALFGGNQPSGRKLPRGAARRSVAACERAKMLRTSARRVVGGFLSLASICLIAKTAGAAEPEAFLQEYCIQCHGAEKQKGDRRFDGLANDFADADTAYDWQEVLDMLNLGEMPPEDEPQPSSEERTEIVSWITGQLEFAYEVHKSAEPQPRLRRLNRREYLNTIRDLCELNVDSFDPTQSFPPDERFEGFETVGSELILSDYLMERYLEAAAATIEKAIDFSPRVRPIREVFRPDDLTDRTFHFRPQVWFEVNVDGAYLDVGHGDTKSYRVYANRFEKGVPADGYYTIRARAEGVGRINRYDPKLLGVDREEPIKLEVVVTDPKVAYPGRRYNASDRTVATFPLKDNEVAVYEVRAWMDKGYVPVLRYANGPQPIKQVLSRIAPKYHLEVLPSNWRDGVAATPAENQEVYLSDVYEGPRVRLYDFSIEGPEVDAWPSESHRSIVGSEALRADQLDVETVIRRFATKAFRRPVLEAEVERYRNFYLSRLDRGEDAEKALKNALTAILASPNFLYVEAPLDDSLGDEASLSHLKQYALASRLSYFLWSSMPDEALFAAAEKGILSDAHELRYQTLRMLRDPKARDFVDGFTDSWLHLNDLGAMPPDSKKFKEYHDRQLQGLMKEETRLFFQDILENNRDIAAFIDSDFTYLNRYMADLYEVDGVATDAFERVALPEGNRRGGLLGQASVLTMTSNGVETSPVVRGIWVLENILGTPPAPPPPDVDPLEPDIRGATTIRDQLAKHRKVETCAECHRKIDPIGFALESFDPIGRYREVYRSDSGKAIGEVDTSGKLVTGEPFSHVDELKDLLLERKELFARCLVEKMLIYALGRELNFGDRPMVDRLTENLAFRGYGLADLVELVATSEAFREI